MPEYEYACRSCGEHLEVVQSFKDDALTVCPACGGELRKVFGAIGVVLKGSGFYRNDNRTSPRTDSKPAPAAAATGAAASTDGATAGGKAEKPAPEKAAPKAEAKTA